MVNKKFLFEPEKGIVCDFLAILSLSTRFENIEDAYSGLDISIDHNIKEAYSRIYSFIKKNNRGISLFFDPGDNGSFFTNLFTVDIMNATSIDELLDKFVIYDLDKMSIALLSHYDIKNNFSNIFYEFLIQNKFQLREFLNGINMSPEAKWDFMTFVENPGVIINELNNALRSIAKEVEREYNINKELLNRYYKIVKDNFEKHGEDIIKSKSNVYDKLVDSNYEKVTFIVTIFSPYTIQFKSTNRMLNVYLGYEFEKGLKVIDEIKMDETLFFKSFTDNTRLGIIEVIKRKELYASEISEQLGLPLSSLSHHLDILCSAGIVNRRNEGKRIYYSLKHDTLMDLATKLLKKIIS